MSTAIQTPAASSAAAPSAIAARSGPGIAEDFQAFLSLLTTQLKNQSPLDPMDANQFTQQLVAFAGIEQQMKTNDTLASLAAGSKAGAVAGALGLVGDTVTADGATTRLASGSAVWPVEAAAAGTATLTITDAQGAAVATLSRKVSAGRQTIAWDGRDASGRVLADGEYRASISARDGAGKAMRADLNVVGVVDGVDLSGAAPVLKIGPHAVPLDRVKGVTQAK